LADYPKFSDWDALGVVVKNYEWVVEDAPVRVVFDGAASLLAPPPTLPSSPPKPISRLAAFFEAKTEWGGAADYVPDQPLWLQGVPTAIDHVLPEARDLGDTPDGRRARLKALLPKLPAYAWMNRNRDVAAAVETLEKLQRTGQIGLVEDAELLLLKTIIAPLQTYAVLEARKDRISFARKTDIKDAIKATRKLRGFFRQNTGVLLEMDGEAARLPQALEQAAKQLSELEGRQKKQPQTIDGLRRLLVKQLSVALIQTMGARSPTTIQHLLGIGDYRPEERHLERQISDVLLEAGL